MVDVRSLLDPEIADAVAAVPFDLSILSPETLSAVREGIATSTGEVELSDVVLRTDHAVGDSNLMLRVHRPVDADGPRPCVYWMHGGGYVLGTNRMEDARFDRWCGRLGCVGVSVDYRLAPDTPYPGPLDDCWAGLRWVVDHADDLGVDVTRLGIGGTSAGGGLAAALALLARDRDEIRPAFQVLVYPMLDDRMVTRSSQWEDPIWPPAANRFGWASYLGDLAGGDVPHHAAPARATDLGGLPPAFVVVGALDPFSDEDVDYATRLRHAGVPTELHVYPGAPHGFDSIMPGAGVSRRAAQEMEAWLATML